MVIYHHPAYGNGGVREQNHLTPEIGAAVILQGLFGMHTSRAGPGAGLGRPGVILTGHDHEGCDVWHHVVERDQEHEEGNSTVVKREWDAVPFEVAKKTELRGNGSPGLREITVRSMMGDFGGNAGLLSAWWEEEEGEWRVEFANCGLGTQHFWWAAHITVVVTLGVGLAYGVALWWEPIRRKGRVESCIVENKSAAAVGEVKASGADRRYGESNGETKRRARRTSEQRS